MAKKITISFLSNPIAGQNFSYIAKINNVLIPYSSARTDVSIGFTALDSNATNVKIQPTLNATLIETYNVLSSFYAYSIISYTIVGSAIEVIFADENIVITAVVEPISLDIVTLDVEINTAPVLRYFMEYLDPMNVPYKVNIYKRGGTEPAQLIYGFATLETGSVNDNLEPIRGSGLKLELEATIDLSLSDLYTEEENQFTVEFYRNNVLLFNGFLKPDGVFQSFVSDRWVLSLQCVDGLGVLKDLAFVKSNGLHFTGKQKAIDVIYNCLVRTNLSMNLNTSINIYYEGLIPSNILDPLTQIYLSVDRFVKTDNSTIMDCQEVLKSVLMLFKASITQINGEWYIYRANELSNNAIVQFRRYSKIDNNYLAINAVDFNKSLGSQINGKYPHHCGANQQISIKGSVSAFRINYKYGFLKGLLQNPNLNHSGFDYPSWDVINEPFIILDPLKSQGLLSKPIDGSFFNNRFPIIESNLVLLNENDTVNIIIKANTINANINDGLNARFQVKHFSMSNAISYLNMDGSWTVTAAFLDFGFFGSLSTTVLSKKLPSNGNVSVSIYQAIKTISLSNSFLYEITNLDIQNVSTVSSAGAQGEFHTVQRQNRPSSIAKDTEEIYNGDSASLIYEGAIFKADKITPTLNWFRANRIESKPILQIAGEDVLRMSQRPAKMFSGDVYGFIPFLSIVSIDSFDTKFMAIEHNFNSKTNITSCRFLEVMGAELVDIKYKMTYDFGNVTKTTITS